jgi:hypothetical protein
MNYVIFVHGIGEQKLCSYSSYTTFLGRLYEKGPFVWKEAYWADVVQPDEERLKAIVNRKGLLYEFLIGSFGDLVAYSKLPYPPDRYSAIQQRFTDTVLALAQIAGKNNDDHALLSVIGHSLGSVIASDGMYDLLKTGSIPSNLTFNGFFTMGSPLALYGLRFGLDNFTKPIRPHIWLNFYYPHDVVAFPLKPLNSAYAEAVTEDICLSPDGLGKKLTALLPLVGIASHSWYFTDRQVISRIAQVLNPPLSTLLSTQPLSSSLSTQSL